MAEAPSGPLAGADRGVDRLPARLAMADARASARLAAIAADLFLDDDQRLDDRTRAAVRAALAAHVDAIAAELRRHAATTLFDADPPVFERLARSGLLGEPALLAELVARVRLDLLAERLLPGAATADCPSLLPRLIDHTEPTVAATARAMLVADSAARSGRGGYELPPELQRRLIWWVAAALRGPTLDDGSTEAIGEAALRCIAAAEARPRREAVAMRLAAALAAAPDAGDDPLVEALGDGRLVLVTAILAQRLGIPYETMRELVIDPASERLVLAFRAVGLPRVTVVKIGSALAAADRRRDLTTLSAQLKHYDAVTVADARAAFAAARLDPEYRSALARLEATS